jgi:hypothetical protein
MPQGVGGSAMPDGLDDSVDAQLIRLCEAFLRHTEVRAVEGDRLDRLPWSRELNAHYVELNRDAQSHQDMLSVILAVAPRTIEGLLAKARVISRHQQDPDAEPIAARILAEDVLRLHLGEARPAAADLYSDETGSAEADAMSSAHGNR